MKTPAFAYLRVSGLGQVDGNGFDRQLSACEAYAKAHGIEIKQVFREEGVTGKSDLDHRPALQAMIVELLSNGTKLVLIEKLDRLARDLIIQETILKDFERRGFKLVSVSEPDLCSDDPTRTLIRQILGAFFEYERKMIVSKLSLARAAKRAKNGRCEGRKAFGTQAIEVEAFAFIQTRRAAGYSYRQIAEQLRLNRFAARKGGWHAATVRRILMRCAKQGGIAENPTKQAQQSS